MACTENTLCTDGRARHERGFMRTCDLGNLVMCVHHTPHVWMDASPHPYAQRRILRHMRERILSCVGEDMLACSRS